MTGPSLELRFVGEPDFVDELVREFGGIDEVQVVEYGAVHDATDLRFDLKTISDAVSAVSALFFNGAMVPTLLSLFRQTHPQRIKISSPFGR